MVATRSLLIVTTLAAAAVLAGCMAPPEGLTCRADSEGNHLSWDTVENATHYHVYRLPGESTDLPNATRIGTTEDTTFTDEDVVVGETYTYFVTAAAPWSDEELDVLEDMAEEDETFIVPEENESFPSEPCIVTAVPVFASPVLGAIALAGCVGAYVVLRKRG
jgi:hypothetical protein